MQKGANQEDCLHRKIVSYMYSICEYYNLEINLLSRRSSVTRVDVDKQTLSNQ